MNSKIIILIGVFILLLSCNKDKSSSESTVKYQVTSTNPTAQMLIAYNDKDGNYISGYYSSGWVSSFTPSNKPFTAKILVSPFMVLPLTVTLKIFVNDTVVQEITGVIGSIGGSATQQVQFVVN